MPNDIKKILGHTNIFKDINKVDYIEQIGSSKYKIIIDEKAYVFSLYNLAEYDDINNETFVNEILESAGLNPLEIYEKGIMPDIERSYKIYEFRDEVALRDVLQNANKEFKEELGEKFGKALKRLHSLKPDQKIDWKKKFLIKSNQIFYKHGLGEIKDDDYILTDFISANRHLTENTAVNLLYKDISDKNIRVYNKDNLDLRAIKSLEYGDGIVDFIEINKIAISHPEFAKATLYSYHDSNKPPRKFFRLLSLYQATALLEDLINIRNNKESKLKDKEIEAIFAMYDNFNNIVPNWAV